MSIYYLNLSSGCAFGGSLIDRPAQSAFFLGSVCCRRRLLKPDQGVILADISYGRGEVRDPTSLLSRSFAALTSPEFGNEMNGARQVKQPRANCADARHTRPMHLDLDRTEELEDILRPLVSVLQLGGDPHILLERNGHHPAEVHMGPAPISNQDGEGQLSPSAKTEEAACAQALSRRLLGHHLHQSKRRIRKPSRTANRHAGVERSGERPALSATAPACINSR